MAAANEIQSELKLNLEKLMASGNLSQDDMENMSRNVKNFQELFAKFQHSEDIKIDWSKIEPNDPNFILDWHDLPPPPMDVLRTLLKKLVVVKLNGGLGTTMGCKGPKSAILVKDNHTFLDLTLNQIEYMSKKFNVDIPLVLMNSFNTDKETRRIIDKYEQKGVNVSIIQFTQSVFPRIDAETHMPIAVDIDVNLDPQSWYPPGHGDFYQSFNNSGKLNEFIEEGKEVVFMSNVDNLGGTIDEKILNVFLKNNYDFLMEVTKKNQSDVKGGTLIHYQGRPKLLEVAQVPQEHMDDFKSLKNFPVFNTNNLWIRLKSMKRILENGRFDLEVIANSKSLQNGQNVLQLEIAAGAAIKAFMKSAGIKVPRTRFLPVKKTSDLLLVMSNLLEVNSVGSLVLARERIPQDLPLIHLDELYYKKIEDFLERFKSIPNMLDLNALTVLGDVTFEDNVSLQGNIYIINASGESFCLEESGLKNCVVVKFPFFSFPWTFGGYFYSIFKTIYETVVF